MKKILLYISLAALPYPAAALDGAAAGYDFSALLNPKNFENVDTSCFNEYGKQVFDISFEKISVKSGMGAFNISLPQKITVKNLNLAVYAANLTSKELEKTNIPRPLDFEIEGLNLTVYGKKNIMKITAARAIIYKENIAYLSPDATISVGGKSLKLGRGASVELRGRMLVVKSSEAGKIGIKI